MAFFSVIIPVYNKENHIAHTLKSVLHQSFIDFEIIIVNDGSTDRSAEKFLEFKDARINYYYKKNGGVSSARNYGIEKSNSNYITFIDADDYWYPDFLEVIAEKILLFPNLKVFSVAIESEISKKVFPSVYSIKKTADCQIVNYFEASFKQTIISSSSAVFEKSVFKKAGLFDINLKNGEDTDMWIRIGLYFQVLFIWKILARYVDVDQSLSNDYKTAIDCNDYLRYAELEKTNAALKKFLDLNRFSLAIKSKITNNYMNYNIIYNAIDLKNLTLKKRIILQLPGYSLKLLIQLKLFLVRCGMGDSVFK